MVESFWSEPSWHKRQQYNARWLLVQQGRTDGFLSSGSKSARGQRRHFFSFFRSQFTIALSGLCISHLLLLLRIPPVDDSSSLRCAPGTSSCLFLRIDYVLHWMITMEWNYQLTRPNWWGGRKYLNSSENMCRLPLERPMGFHAVVMERRAKTGRERESWSIIRRQSGRARRRVWGERQLFQMLGIKRREPTERDERAPGSQFSLGKRRRRRVANSGGSSSIPF